MTAGPYLQLSSAVLSISNAVHIEAPPEKVWAAMVDVERWPEFAPQFHTIKLKDHGPLAVGKSAQVTPKGFFGAPWTVMEYTERRSFTWDANMLPGVHLSAGHTVDPEGSGTRVTLSLQASGPMWMLLAPALARIFRRNVKQEADGMKTYCEKTHRERRVRPRPRRVSLRAGERARGATTGGFDAV